MTTTNHSAPGQALGYYFQLERALSWLSKSPTGSVVGIETEDDVAVLLLSGQKILEQDKSSVDSYPFIPSKKDLWKTLNIWLGGIKADDIDVNQTTFYLVTNKTNTSSIANVIGEAIDDDAVDKAYDQLIALADAQNGEEVLKHITLFKTYTPTEVKKLIKKIKYEDGDGVFGETLRSAVIGDLQLDIDEYTDGVVDEILGWLFKSVTEAWRKNVPAKINRDDFIRHKNKAIQSRKTLIINKLIYEIGDLTSEHYEAEQSNVYVQQLKLINKAERDIKNAIFECLASVYARTILPEKGYLTETELKEFDENLRTHWKNTFDKTAALYSHLPEENVGIAIFADTMNNQVKLNGFDGVNAKLNSGSLHTMADNKTVGWHPKYEDLL
jgi:hypothetical protein